MRAIWLGLVGYRRALELQRTLCADRAAGACVDTLLLLEHEAVYTLGRRATDADVLLDAAARAARGIDVVRTDRGGLATYHGPGQLVGYPILDLGPNADVPGYVATLERAIVATVAEYGITAAGEEGSRGVWVGDAKIAAIGVHVARGITTHGFALNVSCDLAAFDGIVPCGITDRSVTSIEALTGNAPTVHEVAARAAHHLARELGRSLVWTAAAVAGA